MKKLIVTACAAIASAVALASTVESSNVFGVLKVSLADSKPETAKQYFISVPWEKVGASGTAINPTDLVLTKGLSAGDHLFAYGQTTSGYDTKFGAWKVKSENDGENVVLSWEAAQVVDTTVTPNATYPAGSITGVPRGQGLILETQATEIYLSGQYATGGDVTIENGAYTLIGGSQAKDYQLSSSAGALTGEGVNVSWSGTPATGDRIYLAAQEFYEWNGTIWAERSQKDVFPYSPTYTPAKVVIPKGRGAWYSSQATSESAALTITFN